MILTGKISSSAIWSCEKTDVEKILGQSHTLIDKALAESSGNMVVTPNDVDVISDQASEIIAEGINNALL